MTPKQNNNNMLFPFESFRQLSIDETKMNNNTLVNEEPVVHPAVDDILQDVQREEWYKVCSTTTKR